MRRGRWVGIFIAFFLLTTNYQLLSTPSYAASLSMSATVPLSPLWKEALRIHSRVKIDTSYAHTIRITQESLGIEQIPVEKQVIQLLIFSDGILVTEQTKITDKKGVVNFAFVSEIPSTYSVIIINRTEPIPFVVKNAHVSL